MTSIFDIFSIGVGPSSSHTVGPMKAAKHFIDLATEQQLAQTQTIECHLFGSLALTGKGHGTHTAILLGLEGYEPETIDADKINEIIDDIITSKRITLPNKNQVPYDEKATILYHKMKRLPYHANAMTLCLKDGEGNTLSEETYYSIGGGSIVKEGDAPQEQQQQEVPYPFKTGADLLSLSETNKKSISELMLDNELAYHSQEQIEQQINRIWDVMQNCVKRGCRTTGILPGGLNVARRAPNLYNLLQANQDQDPAEVLDWVTMYAIAVNEENAAGGQVVTAPTNGAAGIIPAVLHYYHQFIKPIDTQSLLTFFLTAGAICILYKENASISGAEMGCQGEVGVACSMAAAGLTALRGGTTSQVENAAEIGMEHHLGLTCDPVKGLVQIPCIERNSMGAIKAINAARLALKGEGTQKVSLDKVIKTMRQTGEDMKTRYKETSQGGLAINVVEC